MCCERAFNIHLNTRLLLQIHNRTEPAQRLLKLCCRYVLDVRNNGGGSFPAGVELARMLIDSGDIVLIADSQGVIDSYEATGTAIDSKAPVSLLVNKGTASASEVS